MHIGWAMVFDPLPEGGAFNLTITNVPGPPRTLYAFGAPMREVLPLVPVFAHHAVGIAVVDYAGTVYFGLNADAASVHDLDVLSDAIESSVAEVGLLARTSDPSTAGGQETPMTRERMSSADAAWLRMDPPDQPDGHQLGVLWFDEPVDWERVREVARAPGRALPAFPPARRSSAGGRCRRRTGRTSRTSTSTCTCTGSRFRHPATTARCRSS